MTLHEKLDKVLNDERFFSQLPTIDLLDYNGSEGNSILSNNVRTLQHGRKFSNYKYLYFAFGEAYGVYDSDGQRTQGSGVVMSLSDFTSGKAFHYPSGVTSGYYAKLVYKNDTQVTASFGLSSYRQYFLFGIKG